MSEDRIKKLEDALRAFTELSWDVDAAPGPAYWIVTPVLDGRKALREAGILLNGESPFPSENNGTLSTTMTNGKLTHLGVWLDSRCYGEDVRHMVPEKHLALFDEVIRKAREKYGDG